MSKFVCTSSLTFTVPVGTIVIGKRIGKRRFVLVQDSELTNVNNVPRFTRGEQLPFKGNLWEWVEQS